MLEENSFPREERRNRIIYSTGHPNFLQDKTLADNPKPNKILKWLLLFLGILVVFFIIRAIIPPKSPQTPQEYENITLEPKKPENLIKKITYLIFNKEAKLKEASNDRINILLLGIGGPGHDGPYLTDTIIIASIKTSTKEVAMISVPRDLAVNIPDHGIYKVNHANAFGEAKEINSGPKIATQVLEDTFKIKIPYYIRVDFKAFQELIDIVGGIKVSVERSFTDTSYPAPNFKYQVVSFQKGEQTMDGKTALTFSRSRHGDNGEGSDFARAKRQQKILSALKEKVISTDTLTNPIKINNIIKTIDSHMVTNLQFSDIVAFLKLAKDFNSEQITNLVLDDGPNGFLVSYISNQGAYLLSPKTGNYNEINEAIKNIFDKKNEEGSTTSSSKLMNSPSIKEISKGNIEIKNGTWTAGLAAKIKKLLEEKKYSVSKIGNTENRPQNESLIYIKSNEFQKIAENILKELNLNSKIETQKELETDILLIIGEDLKL